MDKADGYGILGLSVDGNDIIACYETMKRAARHARNGNGSVLLEAHTYRRKGHAEHDNQSYVPEGEIEFWTQNNDPIDRYERYLKTQKIASEDEMKKIVAEVFSYLESELAIADEAGFPAPVSAAYDVFDNSIVAPAFKKKVLE